MARDIRKCSQKLETTLCLTLSPGDKNLLNVHTYHHPAIECSNCTYPPSPSFQVYKLHNINRSWSSWCASALQKRFTWWWPWRHVKSGVWSCAVWFYPGTWHQVKSWEEDEDAIWFYPDTGHQVKSWEEEEEAMKCGREREKRCEAKRGQRETALIMATGFRKIEGQWANSSTKILCSWAK